MSSATTAAEQGRDSGSAKFHKHDEVYVTKAANELYLGYIRSDAQESKEHDRPGFTYQVEILLKEKRDLKFNTTLGRFVSCWGSVTIGSN